MDGRSRALGISVGLLCAVVAGYVALFGAVGEVRKVRQSNESIRSGSAASGGNRRPAAKKRERSKGRAESSFSAAAQRRRRLVFSQVSGAEAFEQLSEPRPGDWLWSFKERGQTLDDYSRTRYNRRTKRRRLLHIQPYRDLTARHRALLPILREYISLFFDVPVSVLPARSLRFSWRSAARRQYDAEQIATHLSRRVPADSLGVIGMAGSDLYALGLNFVFGVGLFQRRAGVYSLHRYGTDKLPLLRRTLQLATHELGHMFSLEHCVFYKCLLNGTNSLAESDRQPLHLCPVCLAKLHHNLRFNPAQRYRNLASFYRRHGLDAEARFAAARAGEVSGK